MLEELLTVSGYCWEKNVDGYNLVISNELTSIWLPQVL